MSEMASTKPYRIAKRTVGEAYQLVKANRGAAGVDEETIAIFEQNLPGNLSTSCETGCRNVGQHVRGISPA
jgi:RNA-directed DNA polymerase